MQVHFSLRLRLSPMQSLFMYDTNRAQFTFFSYPFRIDMSKFPYLFTFFFIAHPPPIIPPSPSLSSLFLNNYCRICYFFTRMYAATLILLFRFLLYCLASPSSLPPASPLSKETRHPPYNSLVTVSFCSFSYRSSLRPFYNYFLIFRF